MFKGFLQGSKVKHIKYFCLKKLHLPEALQLNIQYKKFCRKKYNNFVFYSFTS